MIKMRIRFDAPDFASLSTRELKRIHRMAGEAAIDWFLRERLPLRFDGSIADELGWQPRTAAYLRHKAKARRGTAPMVFTGHTRALFRRAVARVTPKFVGFRVNNLGPQFRRFSGTWAGSKNGVGIRRAQPSRRPDLNSEITRMTDGEIAHIGHIYTTVFTRLCQEALTTNRNIHRIG